ncbi:hypothetical protein EVAR_40386_1 [Eumeta japonica]|uniref:Uncharacterized protein n=1 Tax=Eumeta variegata TaxID=151549 RepID=A0A4C1WBV5_EUMVA|nr:hypothetical protein EVAR_40386_1 [Eumeta japonica]
MNYSASRRHDGDTSSPFYIYDSSDGMERTQLSDLIIAGYRFMWLSDGRVAVFTSFAEIPPGRRGAVGVLVRHCGALFTD